MNIKNKTYNVDEVRKNHGRAYEKWAPVEDALLSKEYGNFKKSDKTSFLVFLSKMAVKLGRKTGAIRSRLNKLLDTPKSEDDVLNIQPTAESVSNIEINEQFKKILFGLENTDGNFFITGRAGTGKSTLLQYFRDTTKKKIVVLAPTGVAALNVQGQTIHSFFNFEPGITPDSVKIYYGRKSALFQSLEVLIIDEISMVRADLLDCIDKFLRLNGRHKNRPFGGVQVVLFGDLYQLPPVVPSEEKELFLNHYNTPYFFSATAFPGLGLRFVELQKVYRQKDKDFLDILDSIRIGEISNEQLDLLNTRVVQPVLNSGKDIVVRLVPTNQMADGYNLARLEELNGEMHSSEAAITGEFGKSYFPTSSQIYFKKGAQVMMLNNDSAGRWVNGDLGKIEGIEEADENIVLRIKFFDGRIHEAGKHMWEVTKFFYNKESKRIESKAVGTFTQYPVRLAWAVTIHKCQGKTFDNVAVDFGHGTFAPGQAYVALSRCKTLEGLFLINPIEEKHIFVDNKILEFMENFKKEEEIIRVEDLPF